VSRLGRTAASLELSAINSRSSRYSLRTLGTATIATTGGQCLVVPFFNMPEKETVTCGQEVQAYRTCINIKKTFNQNLRKNEMKIKGKAAVPPGQYLSEFVGVEEMEHAEYGAGLIWSCMIIGGKHDAQITSRATGDVATDKNACGKFFKSVTGKAWHPESDNDPEPFVGRRFHIIVEDAPSGTRVASAISAQEEAATSGETDDLKF